MVKFKTLGKDWISNLPNDLLCEILSHLSTKDSVRTSVLSKRWKNIWLGVPALDLDFMQIDDDYVLLELMERFIEYMEARNLDVKRFELIYDVLDQYNHSHFVSMIDEVIKRRVCHLSIVNTVDVEEELVRLPVSIYSCATLVSLTLYCVLFDYPGLETIVSLPLLKTMHLEKVGNEILETLVSNSPVLEELTIIIDPDDNFMEVVRVRSQSLRRFTLESPNLVSKNPDVEIDVPILEYMSIINYHCHNFTIHSIGPFAKVGIDLGLDVNYHDPMKRTIICGFFNKISTIHEMVISDRTLKVFYGYSKLETLPRFSNLSHLEASFVKTSWKLLPTFLDCCPNLHSLILEFDYLPKDIKLPDLSPPCFLSSLELVQLNIPFTSRETSGKMKLARYFVMNCAVLKELSVSESFENIIKKISKISKRSKGCNIVMF